jgi:hypothetical protein
LLDLGGGEDVHRYRGVGGGALGGPGTHDRQLLQCERLAVQLEVS